RKEINNETTARLAQWRVNPEALSGSLDLFSGSYTAAGENDTDGVDNMTASSDPKGAPIAFDGNNLLAPGAKGSTILDFSGIELGDTEVAYQIKFVDIVPGADLISQYVTIGEYGAGDGKGITPLSDQTLTDVLKRKMTYTASVDGGTTVSGNLATLETDLKTLTIPANGKVTIAWEWPYETGSDANDVQDTEIADLVDSTDLRLVVRLAYQAVQVD
ncbi:MAG: hypothetical protein L0G47_09295, partial [Lacticaseibacillus paracasei]|nr:hypothetical protein [Lacticaseibacillus paracasei]